jgi:hypothetical protein
VPLFFSLVRPERISSPITSTAAVTVSAGGGPLRSGGVIVDIV